MRGLRGYRWFSRTFIWFYFSLILKGIVLRRGGFVLYCVCPVRLSPICMAVRTLYGPERERVRDPVHLELRVQDRQVLSGKVGMSRWSTLGD